MPDLFKNLKFRRAWIVPGLILMLMLASCAAPGIMGPGAEVDASKETEEEAAATAIEDSPDEAQAVTKATQFKEIGGPVAILPFANDTGEVGLAGVLRKSLYNRMEQAGYLVVSRDDVDRKALGLEASMDKAVFDMDAAKVAKSLGTGAIVYGTVKGFKVIGKGAGARVEIDAELRMIDAAAGTELWRLRKKASYPASGKSARSSRLAAMVMNGKPLPEKLYPALAADSLAMDAVESLPRPAKDLAPPNRPVIKEVLTNAAGGPLSGAKALRVGMEGSPGLEAYYRIKGHNKKFPMKEVQGGVYLAELPASSAPDVKGAPVTVFLRRPDGEVSSWPDTSGLVTMDSSPPEKTSGLSWRIYKDRIALDWDPAAEMDLKGWRVMRSVSAESGFVEVGFASTPAFTDNGVEPGRAYFYRLVPVDEAGNSGPAGDAVRIEARSTGPEVISGVIDSDKTLGPGDYLVTGTVTVTEDATLSIKPGARIFLAQGVVLRVLGAIYAVGEVDSPIELMQNVPGERWYGLVVEGGTAELVRVRASGAETAFELIRSTAFVEHVLVEDNFIAIRTEGAPAAKINRIMARRNNTAVIADSSTPNISSSVITRNRTGIFSFRSAPDIKNNDIFDNIMNIEAVEGTVDGNGNYYGTNDYARMRFTGDVKAALVKSAPQPGGRMIKVIPDPFARLNERERDVMQRRLNKTGMRSYSQGKYSRAATEFEQSLRVGDNAVAYNYLALCHRMMGDTSASLGYFEKGLGVFPKEKVLLKGYGELLLALGRNLEARTVLEKALAVDPEDRLLRLQLERMD